MNYFKPTGFNSVIILIFWGIFISSAQAANIIYNPLARTEVDIRRVPEDARGPCDRVSAVTDDDFVLRVLVPEHTGLTTQPQPTLYWYVSEPVAAQFVFQLEQKAEVNSFDYFEPLIKTTFDLSVKTGIHSLSLAKYDNVKLEKGIKYIWSLSLVCDPYNPSVNRLAVGTIMHIEPSSELAETFKNTQLDDLPYLYAKEGFWYDAMHSLSELIKKTPNLRRIRAELLQQVGLHKVAAFEQE